MPSPLSLALAVALCPGITLACGPTPPTFDGDPAVGVSVSVGRIADRSWEPVTIAGEPVPDGAGLSLSVSFEGRVEGATGCNRFTGTADLDAGTLQLGPIAVTEMACVEPDRMEREAAWLQALVEARGFVVSPAGLWLMREDGTVAVCLG